MRGRGRRARDDHVVLRAHLQVALDARRRVVGPLALVAVRQQQHDGRLLAPLLVGGGDVLVDDRLRAVGEVAELRLPQGQRVGPLDRVAVLERHRAVLAQQRVVHVEAALVLAEVRQRQPLLAVRAVVDDRVTLHEGSAARVLPGEAHVRALHEERAEGEELAEAPVDRAAAAHVEALVQQLLDLRVHREAVGLVDERVADLPHDLDADAGGLGLTDGLLDRARAR